MMNRHFDEELKELLLQVASKNRQEAIVKELQSQQSVLEARVEELKEIKDKEQLDVERLEQRSLTNYFYQVVGKLDDKLTKEKKEAYEAAVKYDVAYQELQAVKSELRNAELEYGRVRRSDERYREVLKEKQEAMKLSDMPEAGEIFRLEAQIASLEVRRKELDEALTAGRCANRLAAGILDNLSSAKSYGTWDLIGGGLVADMAKHSHLDEAQRQVERLQRALREFKTELADVQITAYMQVNVDEFLRFADYFFDGLFADWSVLNQISESQRQVQRVKSQIETLLGKLGAAYESVVSEQKIAEAKLQELVKKTAL